MKRTVLVIFLAFILGITIKAQTGIGVRGIYGVDRSVYNGVELSVQKPGSYELDFGYLDGFWKVTALKQRSIINRKHFGLYFGFGLGAGYYNSFDNLLGTFALNLGSYIMLGRIQVGVDGRPEWNFYNPPGNNISYNLALSARWMFGKY